MQAIDVLMHSEKIMQSTGYALNRGNGGTVAGMRSKIRKIIMFAFILSIVLAAAMPVVSYAESDVENNSSETAFVSHWQDYIGKKIGVLTGTPLEDVAKERFKGSEVLYFNSYPDLSTALLAGEINAYLCDEPNANMTHHEEPRIDYIHERLTHNDYAFAFRKNDADSAALLSEFNAFLKEIKEDGTYEEIEDIWFGTDESRKTVDIAGLTGENGTITIATTSTDMPWSYIKDNKNVGFDIDIVARFCKERGYALSIMDVDFAARIPALQSGRCDFTTDMNVTPERQEEVLFSDATADGGVVVVTLAENLTSPDSYDEAEGPSGGKALFKGVKDSFNKTFIREDRYKLFLKGILTTVMITLLSVIFGTMLGFLVYMGCRRDGKVSNAIAGFFIWLIQGMPVVVLLMILYYILFAHADISGTAVAVFAFTLVFGSGVFVMLKAGVGAIDKGQTEAALSLGYGDIHSFFRIILPQALPHFLPAYKGEIVALLKATAIVGYIAVQDLTKMGDIVRGRTYEAFFPLIAVAVIYFILAAGFKFIVGRVEVFINPRRRKREDILKGVKTHD